MPTISVSSDTIAVLGARDAVMLQAIADAVDSTGRCAFTHDEWSERTGLSAPQVYRAMTALREHGAITEVLVRKAPMTKLTGAGKRMLGSRKRDDATNDHDSVTLARNKGSHPRAGDSSFSTSFGSTALEHHDDDSTNVADRVTRNGWERRTANGLPRPVIGKKSAFVPLRSIVASLLDGGHEADVIEQAIAVNDGAWTMNALLEQMRRAKANRSPRDKIAAAMNGGGRTAIVANRDRLARMARGEA